MSGVTAALAAAEVRELMLAAQELLIKDLVAVPVLKIPLIITMAAAAAVRLLLERQAVLRLAAAMAARA